MTDNATVRTVEHNEASALPETGWLWRRVFVFACTAVVLAMVWRVSERVTDVGTLKMTIRYLIFAVYLFALLYLAGASTEAITRLLAAVRTTRKETVSTAAPPATITTPDSKVETPPEDTGNARPV